MVFDLSTGDFKCNMCEYKYAFGGTGQVKIDGFNVSLSAVTSEYQIFVSVNMWDRQGKAVMTVFGPGTPVDAQAGTEGFKEFWTDVNIDNNTLNCGSFQPAK